MRKFGYLVLVLFVIAAVFFYALWTKFTLAETARLNLETSAINAHSTQIMATVQAKWTPTPTEKPVGTFQSHFILNYKGILLDVRASLIYTGEFLYDFTKADDLNGHYCLIRTGKWEGTDPDWWSPRIELFCDRVFR